MSNLSLFFNNGSMNYTIKELIIDSCIQGNTIQAECLYSQFCPQIPAHFLNWALICAVVFLIQDLGLELALKWVVPRLKTSPDSPKLHAYVESLKTPEGRQSLRVWVKDRVLWLNLAFFLTFLSFV